jgi:hypothetical protein
VNRPVSRWLSFLGNVASILSFLGFTVATVFYHWTKQRPLFLAGLGLAAGFFAGQWVERRATRKKMTLASPPPSEPQPAEMRASLVEVARARAVELTSQPWEEFPKWRWSLRLSRDCLQKTMQRVDERVHIRMSGPNVEQLVQESVRMYIRECLAGWEAAARSRQASDAARTLRRQNSFVNRWRHW